MSQTWPLAQHVPATSVWPAGHTQAPETHVVPGRQATPHSLQLALSLARSTHAVPHWVVPGGQVQAPSTQARPAPQHVAPQTKLPFRQEQTPPTHD